MSKINELLQSMLELGASDLHLTTGFQPYFRIHGDMEPVKGWPVLAPDLAREIISEIIPAHNQREIETHWDTDFAYEITDTARFRVNVFIDRHGLGAVLRQIPSKVPTFEELGLPKVLRDFCYLTKGLVVVTGPTGSGKSTTLAAMIDHINSVRSDHIITIEDPIEFVHKPKKCLINQREVHRHTKSFANALRAALREDPDIVLVGEMRDLETTEIAIETAETGHLVFGTLHTNTAASTVDRIIDKFPTDRQNQIRMMLSDSLRGVVAQTLCKKKTKGRVAAIEVLVVNTGIASNIREGKTHQIPSLMQTGRGLGMQCMNDALLKFVTDGVISPKEAYLRAVDKDSLAKKFMDVGLPFSTDEFDTSLAMDTPPDNGAKEKNLQLARILSGSQEILRKDPNNLNALNNAAWILSTSMASELRNGKESIRLAEKALALSKGKDPHVLDTLAAAYAEAGLFDKALSTANKAMDIATLMGENDLIVMLRGQIKLYESKRPLRDI